MLKLFISPGACALASHIALEEAGTDFETEVVDLRTGQQRTQVTVENAGHNVFESHPYVQDLIVRFFRGDTVSDTRMSLPPPTFRIA